MSTAAAKLDITRGIITQYRYWPVIYLVVTALLTGYIFWDGLIYMAKDWEREEFSHGYMIPFISLYLVIQQLPKLTGVNFNHQLWAVALVILGLMIFLLGELSALYVIVQYGFITVVFGIVVGLIGARGFMVIAIPLCYLLFMIPLPNFLLFNLSQHLQLISSTIGVHILRMMDVSVFLEGNVIDLGTYQLQVVDACSGLRYLFPLMSFGFLIAYIYKAAFWQRAVIFLSTIPITIFMNSFRIAVIGLTVDIWGIAAAEGFLHDFEGWVIFMSCLLLLAIEIYLLHRFAGGKGRVIDKIAVHLPAQILPQELATRLNQVSYPALLVLCCLLLAIPLKSTLTHREETIPARTQFTHMPLIIDEWMGREGRLDQEIFEVLKVNDYVVVNYLNGSNSRVVNLYVAYYESQRKGASVHSPKTCLPGGGWEISEFGQVNIPRIDGYADGKFIVNRAVIQNGNSRSLVYYWFQQRGRLITSEYLLKWYIFQDALTKNRTDGALVRLIMDVSADKDIVNAEAEMQSFLEKLAPLLPAYIPE